MSSQSRISDSCLVTWSLIVCAAIWRCNMNCISWTVDNCSIPTAMGHRSSYLITSGKDWLPLKAPISNSSLASLKCTLGKILVNL
jgi:hypothetical protein